MKKINFLLTILFMIVTFFTPEMVRFIKAESNPFALITTIRDQESNNSFLTAVTIEENETNVASPNYKNDYIGGIISSASDVDYFCLNSFSTGSMLLQLTMLDTSFESTYNYNFEIYEHINTVNSSKGSNYMTLLYSSSTPGTNEYYRFDCKATSYFIKIFSTSGSSTRNSYKLSYDIYRQKTSYNLSQYVAENSEGYALWESDFKFGGSQNTILDIEERNFITSTLHVDYGNIYHDTTKKYYEYGEFPVLEIYFWGPNTRNSIYELIDEVIDATNEKIEDIEQYNNKIEIVSTAIEIGVNICTFGLSIYSSDFGEIFDLAINTSNFVFALLGISLIPKSATNLENFIHKLENLKTAIYNYPDTSDDHYVFAVTYKNTLTIETVPGYHLFYNNCNFDSSGSKHVEEHRYISSTIYDSKQFDKNNNGNYNYIYGKCYFDNIENRLKMAYGI